MIRLEDKEGRWRGIKLSRRRSELMHLLFADDMILFSQATSDQVQVIQNCLEAFGIASGQQVNLHKSQIMFSSNVYSDLAGELSKRAGIARTENIGRYLGVSSIQGRTNKDTYAYLLEKINKKLEGWKMKYLSFAGR